MPATKLLPVLALSAIVTGCAAPTPLGGAQVRSLLVGNTAQLPNGFAEYYAEDGTLQGRVGSDRYVGSWLLRDDAFCTSLSQDPPVCTRVFQAGSRLSWSPDAGKPVPLTVIPGKPPTP